MLLIAGFFALLLLADWSLYFRHAGHFFQGDSVFLLDHRATSIAAFLREFTNLHASGWYRPLSNEVIESLLYPIFGLSPIPYRIPVYAIFLAVTVALYALAFAISRRHLFAAVTTAFFSIHSTNAYTTYDVGFIPELLYTLFYLNSVLAYVTYLQRRRKSAYVLSLVCFAASLLSKESAVTLPGVLMLTHILFDSSEGSISARLFRAVRSNAAHVVILFAYLLLVGAYLGVGGFSVSKLLKRPAPEPSGGYVLALDKTILTNADLAFSFAFNLPRGGWGQWRNLTPAMIIFLKSFRALVLFIAAFLLFRPEQKTALFGLGWLFLTMLPTLPLLDHFIPYYLFLPIAGLSLVVGAVAIWSYDALCRVNTVVASAFLAIVFAGTLNATSRSIRRDIQDNWLLGASAELAFNSLTDLKRLYPVMPAKANLYFEDANEPMLPWDQNGGGLIRMAYNTSDISAQYASQGDPLAGGVKNLIVLAVRKKHIVDDTDDYRANPEHFSRYQESPIYRFEVSKTEVTAGRDDYAVTISSLHDVPVRINYMIDEDPVQSFSALLDADGQVTFSVSSQTRKGVYKFLGFKISSQDAWIRADKSIVVR